MIAVKLEGRLGNQLFQYAFIYAAAKTSNTSFYLDKRIDYLLLDKYFEIEKDFAWLFDHYIFSIKGFKNLFSHHLRYKFYSFLEYAFHLTTLTVDNCADPLTQLELASDRAIYQGFFQSEDYFIHRKNEVIDLFSIKKRYKQQFENIRRSLPFSKKYVTVHIRRGDYLEHSFALRADYYHKAIKSIHNDENYYVFISDDFEFIDKEFNYIKNRYLSRNNEIIDLQFLINADVCILSNSSFSWWGAYLNKNEPQVLAPAYWLGKTEEFPVKVIPRSWTKFY